MYSLRLSVLSAPCRCQIRLFHATNQLLKDYYSILGVSKNANQKDIKKAYYQLAKKYHPDTNKDDPHSMKKFQEVSEAYEVLSDDGKRSEYDNFGSGSTGGGGQTGQNPFRGQNPFGGGFPGGQKGGYRRSGGQAGGARWEYQSNVDPEELFKQIFGEFNRARGGGMRGFMNPFDDIFHNFQFRGGLEATCNISFMEAAKGVTKPIDVVEMDRQGRRTMKMVNVPIPAGISDGQTLRMSLGGGQEIFITVRVDTSDYFRRENYDVHTTAFISLSQALLGGVIRITGLHQDINLRIPQGTSSHTEMTLSGRGIKNMESHSAYGDHIVHIMIKMPVNMTEEQKELIREYAYLEKDTPGTIAGIDKSTFGRYKSRKSTSSENSSSDSKQAKESQSSNTEEMPKADVRDTPEKGTLAKIVDAISENETVKALKKKFFG